MNTSLKVYPSGFMGSAYVPQTTPIDLVAMSRQLIQSGVVNQKSQYTANLNVVELDVEGQASGSSVIRAFEFCEKIIVTSVNSFGTDKLIDWVNAQPQSPEYGDNHKRFLDETFRYVFGGHQRSLPAASWVSILTVGDNRLTFKSMPDWCEKYLSGSAAYSGDIYRIINKYNNSLRDISIQDFIHCWMMQPSGIRDLQTSINVLFGKR